jgi:predicted esterase
MNALFCLTVLTTALSGCGDDGAAQQAPRDVEWHQVSSAQGTINVALIRPDPGTRRRHPVIFALPWGVGTRGMVLGLVGRYWDREAPARGYYVVAPEIQGQSLYENADEVIPAIFAWMAQELDFDPDAVVVTGASNGGLGAFFAAVAQPARFSAIIGMPGLYPGRDEDLARLAGKRIWLMAGQLDTDWVEAATATRDALQKLGINVQHDILPGQNHVLTVAQTVLMDWVDEVLGR